VIEHYGIWELAVTGPPALLQELSFVAEVEGFYYGEHDRKNLEYVAADQTAKILGYESYDSMPEQFTPVEFSAPERTANTWRNLDDTQQWFVAVYEITQCYGGPEEGGWWYHSGELIRQTAVPNCDEAKRVRDELRVRYPERPRYPERQEYEVVTGIAPHVESFPETRPHYE
jgi:hypothetical protein